MNNRDTEDNTYYEAITSMLSFLAPERAIEILESCLRYFKRKKQWDTP